MIPLRRILVTGFAGVTLAACGGPAQQPAPEPAPGTRPAAPAPSTAPAAPPVATAPTLLDPASATRQAPASFKVRFETTKGDFVVEVQRAWAPKGADRFYNLVRLAYFDEVRFFRVISGFMVQFGIHGDPRVSEVWSEARMPDDPVTQSNKRGTVKYATAGPGTRTTQLFINFGDNAGLDGQGFAPFAKVIEGMDVVDALYAEYGEGAPRGRGPRQDRAQSEGNAYFKAEFPKLDHIKTARVVDGG